MFIYDILPFDPHLCAVSTAVVYTSRSDSASDSLLRNLIWLLTITTTAAAIITKHKHNKLNRVIVSTMENMRIIKTTTSTTTTTFNIKENYMEQIGFCWQHVMTSGAVIRRHKTHARRGNFCFFFVAFNSECDVDYATDTHQIG